MVVAGAIRQQQKLILNKVLYIGIIFYQDGVPSSLVLTAKTLTSQFVTSCYSCRMGVAVKNVMECGEEWYSGRIKVDLGGGGWWKKGGITNLLQ